MVLLDVSVYRNTKDIRLKCHADYRRILAARRLAVPTPSVLCCPMDLQNALVCRVISNLRTRSEDASRKEILATRTLAVWERFAIPTVLQSVIVPSRLSVILSGAATVIRSFFSFFFVKI